MDGAMHTIIMAFLSQTFDIKILNANYIEAIDIHPRELMQEIISLAVDSLMQLRDFILEGLIIIGSSLNYVGESRQRIWPFVPLCLCGWVRA